MIAITYHDTYGRLQSLFRLVHIHEHARYYVNDTYAMAYGAFAHLKPTMVSHAASVSLEFPELGNLSAFYVMTNVG